MENANKKTNEADDEETWQLVERAQQGDELALAKVKRLANLPYLIDNVGNLAKELERRELAEIGDLLVAEAVRNKIEEMRAGLLSHSASAAEKLLVDRVVVDWLQLYRAQLHAKDTPDDAQQRQIDRLHRRHLNSVRALITVQKATIQMQIFIGQINVGGRRRGKQTPEQ